MEREAILARIKKAVYNLDPEAKVILYGSRAREDDHNWSDWDVLILSQKQVDNEFKRQIRDAIFEVELTTEEIITTIIHNEDEWKKHSITPFYQNVKRDGVVL